MEKVDYEHLLEELQEVDTKLRACHDDNPGVVDWEENVRYALVAVADAEEKVEQIIAEFDVQPTGDPEYEFEFSGGLAYVCRRRPNAHANTKARFFTRTANGTGSTGWWTWRVFDTNKYPPRHPLTYCEYRSGHDNKLYRLRPNFSDKTVRFEMVNEGEG